MSHDTPVQGVRSLIPNTEHSVGNAECKVKPNVLFMSFGFLVFHAVVQF